VPFVPVTDFLYSNTMAKFESLVAFVGFVLMVASIATAQPIFGTIDAGDYLNLPELPGIDFVGFGYDIRFSVAQEALKLPIVDYAFSDMKVYMYPADPFEIIYKVPDQVFVRTVAYCETKAYLFDSLDDYESTLSNDVGVSTTTISGLNETVSICVLANINGSNSTDSGSSGSTTGSSGSSGSGDSGSSSNQTCTTVYANNQTKSFSIGSKSSSIMDSLNKTESIITQNTESTQMFTVLLDSRFFRSDVKAALTDLSQYTFVQNPRAYFKFLETYGTHYVVQSTLGGDVTQTNEMDTSTTSTNNGLNTSSSNTQNLTSQQALISSSNSFSSSLTNTVNTRTARVTQNITITSTTDWDLLGGNSNLVNLLSTSSASDAIFTWKQSIPLNPVSVKYRLREISTLYDDSFLRLQLHQAIIVFLSDASTDFLVTFDSTQNV